MKTTYLLRNAAWLTDAERRSARRFAREVEKRHLAPGAADPILALELYTVATAMVVFQRAQARFAEAHVAQGDVAAAFPLLRAAQDALAAATTSLRECLADRPALPQAATQPQPQEAAAAPAPAPVAPAAAVTATPTPAASTPSPSPTTTDTPPSHSTPPAQVSTASPPPPNRPKIICPSVVRPATSH